MSKSWNGQLVKKVNKVLGTKFVEANYTQWLSTIDNQNCREIIAAMKTPFGKAVLTLVGQDLWTKACERLMAPDSVLSVGLGLDEKLSNHRYEVRGKPPKKWQLTEMEVVQTIQANLADLELVQALNKKLGTKLTLGDYRDWLGEDRHSDTGRPYFDRAVRRLLPPDLYTSGERLARLPGVLCIALGIGPDTVGGVVFKGALIRKAVAARLAK